METIRSWLIGITAAAVIAALADSLTPEGPVKKLGKLAGGLVLLLAVLGPVGKLSGIELSDLTAQYRLQSETYSAALETENDRLIKTIIEEETAAYIQDKAAELGIVCTAQVTCAADGEGVPVPASVVISGELRAEQMQALREMIGSDLNIPPEEQQYKGAGEP